MKLITEHEQNIEPLVTELSEGVYEDEFTRKIFQEKIKDNSVIIKELKEERERLEAELSQIELTDDFRQEVKEMASKVRKNLSDATFNGKRTVMDKLDLRAIFRYEDGTRWLDLSCNLFPEWLSCNILEANILLQRQSHPLLQ